MIANLSTAPQPIPINETCISQEKEASKLGKKERPGTTGKTPTRALETSRVGSLTHQLKAGLSDKGLLQGFKEKNLSSRFWYFTWFRSVCSQLVIPQILHIKH